MNERMYPLISVVVPVYNIEDYLEKCISSIIKQTYSNIEIILVDDGSTDNSPFICDNFAKVDSRISVIHKEWGGVLSARKMGVNLAKGRYVISVDGDDWIEKDRIEFLANQISSSSADMIYISGYWKDAKGESRIMDASSVASKTYFGEEIRKEVFPLLQVINKCFSSPIKGSLCMWAIKRGLLKKKINLIDDRISMSEDHICVWFCLLASETVCISKHLSYHYVQRHTSLTYTKDIKERERMKIWHDQLKNYLIQQNATSELIKIFTFLNTLIILSADYELMLLEDINYLFPYPKVKKGSKVVVYGAGKFGCHMIRALDKSKEYTVVSWVDQNEKRQPILGYMISAVQTILNVEYDFIVIAVIYEEMSLEIKESLTRMGIEENKIAMMDPSVISEGYLDRVFEKKNKNETRR